MRLMPSWYLFQKRKKNTYELIFDRFMCLFDFNYKSSVCFKRQWSFITVHFIEHLSSFCRYLYNKCFLYKLKINCVRFKIILYKFLYFSDSLQFYQRCLNKNHACMLFITDWFISIYLSIYPCIYLHDFFYLLIFISLICINHHSRPFSLNVKMNSD